MDIEISFRSTNLENIKVSEIRCKYSAAGDRILRYYIDFRHTVLNLHKELSAPELSILQNKVDTLMAQWDSKYATYQINQQAVAGKELAEDMTLEAELRRDRLKTTLKYTLSIDDVVDWNILKDHTKFERKEFDEKFVETTARLSKPRPIRVGLFQSLFGQRRRIERRYRALLEAYNEEIATVAKKNSDSLADWEKRRDAWNAQQDTDENRFLQKQEKENAIVDALYLAWKDGDTSAIEEHASMVLEASDHEDAIPKQWQLQYYPESKLLVVEYLLPNPDDLPTTKTVRFVAASGELKETKISELEKKRLFDDLCYQLCLRSIHELFEADTLKHIDSIAFNGKTDSINPATGNRVEATILSLVANKDEFLAINLAQVDPKACFKSLKGVSAASLVGLTPVAPIVELEKDDKRFVDGRNVHLADDGTTNLAAMDWEEFEHLVRELFEKEFALRGGEVRVTQSSSDGGVDAVAFDPDPISGGKIVIQAKRYTRTVGVAAVRDLYGTTMNEGAIKGILVTTADYGPDAHKFASDKPLTLMSGAHLLHLLEKHGVRANIDLSAARKDLGLRR